MSFRAYDSSRRVAEAPVIEIRNDPPPLQKSRPPFINGYLTRHKKPIYYFRRNGVSTRLPDDYGSPAFWAAYEHCLDNGHPPKKRDRLRFHPNVARAERSMESALRRAKAKARARGLPFDLTLDWAMATIESNAYRCELTGIAFYTPANAGSNTEPFIPSIDRKNCDKGYTVDNVRIVIWAINAMLLDWGLPVFERVADAYQTVQAVEARMHARAKRAQSGR